MTAGAERMNPIWANKTALSLGAVGSLLVMVIPATIWFATIAAKVDQLSQEQQSIRSNINAIISDRNGDSTRLTKLETLFPQITEQLAEIKSSLAKIETSLRR